MAARTKQATTAINTYKLAAVGAQLLSFWATYLLVAALFGDSIGSFAGAFLAEFLLIKGKQLVFAGDNPADPTGWGCIVADAAINGAGMWAGVLKLDDTQLWVMLQQSMHFTGKMDGIPALIVALVLGFLLSIAPHSLWRD